MRARMRLIGALATAGVVCTVGLTAQRGAVQAGDGLLVGQVIDAGSGRPVSQAVVWLGGPPTPAGATTATGPTRLLTGSDGRFVFRGLAPGSYTVHASKAGYLPGSAGRNQPQATARAIAMPPNGRIGDIVVRMWKAASLSGRVSDETGEPLVRVGVGVYGKRMAGGRASFDLAVQLVTDDRGMYRAGALPPGDYLVAMNAAVRAGAMEAGVPVLHARGGLSTRAVAMGDFLLQLGLREPTPPPIDDGRFRTYPPTFHPGTTSALDAAVLRLRAGEDLGGVDIQLQPTGMASVHGRVAGPDLQSEPMLQFASVETRDLVPSMLRMSPVTSRGEFAFPGVAEGRYVVGVITAAATSAGSPVRLLWAEEPVVVSGSNVSVTVLLREGVRVRGFAQFDGMGAPPAGALRIPVSVERAYGPTLTMATTMTDASGAFTTLGMPGGSYVVRVTNSPRGWMFAGAFSRGRDISSSPVDLLSDLDGVVLRFTDRWTGLQGTVRDARGLPDANATVLVFPLDPSEWEGYGPAPRRLRLAPASAAGTYAVDPLPAGDYYVIAVTEEPSEWRDPSVLATLSRSATRVHVRTDGKTTLDLRTQ